jgi:hypothetical protein
VGGGWWFGYLKEGYLLKEPVIFERMVMGID